MRRTTQQFTTAGSPSRDRRSSASATPRVLQLRAGQGTREDVLLLQRLAGNKAVASEIVRLPEVVGFGGCDSGPLLECSAKASRSFSKSISVPAPAKKRDKEGNVTYKGSGSVTAQFTSTVKISLASVPTDVSKCAAGKYKTLIQTKLSPHEQDHKKRFLTTNPAHSYNGTFTKTIKESGDDQASVQDSIKSQLTDALDSEVSARETRNDEYAITAIDPFSVTADISDCPECAAPEEE